MRTSLFLSTLFAVSMIGGVALAEKPQVSSAMQPRAVERFRAHGDIVDKVYSTDVRARGAAAAGSNQVSQPRQTRSPLDRAASRVNCSDTGADCNAGRGAAATHAVSGEAGGASTGRAGKIPPFLDKILGSDRMACNEADECSMSNRAIARAWSRHAADHKAAGASVPLAAQTQIDRKSQQASSAVMTSNEADESSMPNKARNQEWAMASIKAGTWKGPAKEPVSNAAIRIAEQRAAEGANHATQTKSTRGKAEPAQHTEHPH